MIKLCNGALVCFALILAAATAHAVILTKAKLAEIKTGMTKTEVEAVLGKPSEIRPGAAQGVESWAWYQRAAMDVRHLTIVFSGNKAAYMTPDVSQVSGSWKAMRLAKENSRAFSINCEAALATRVRDDEIKSAREIEKAKRSSMFVATIQKLTNALPAQRRGIWDELVAGNLHTDEGDQLLRTAYVAAFDPPTKIKANILQGRWEIGMTAEQVKVAWGLYGNYRGVFKVNATVTSLGRDEQWVFATHYLYFTDGVLRSYQTVSR